MSSHFSDFIDESIQLINQRLTQLLNEDANLNPDLKGMMEYSINAGGKRVRPLILLAILKTLNQPIDTDALTVGAALEAVHTYSLIHDDLPAMDNDDLRRGQLTSHKKYGEAQAILTGDALLTIAFQWIALTELKSELKNEIIADLALDAGPSGMISGQLLDIQGNQRNYTLAELKQLHHLKTGRMLIFPASAALKIVNADSRVYELVVDFMKNYGLAFQVHDDIIDVTESSDELGKTAGKDQNLNKNTYVNLLGLSGAQAALADLLTKCHQQLDALAKLNPESDLTLLEGFLTYLK